VAYFKLGSHIMPHMELDKINQLLKQVQTEIAEKKHLLSDFIALKVRVSNQAIETASLAKDISGIELTAKNIMERLDVLADQVIAEYGQYSDSNPPVFVSLMNGGLPFAGWFQAILAEKGFNVEFTTMKTKSYTGTTSGTLSITSNFSHPVVGRDVIILDDIADTLKTGNGVKAIIAGQRAASVKMLVLLDKQDVRADPNNNPDYSAFKVNNEFIIGCGMDYYDLCRYLDSGDIKVVDETQLPSKEEQEQLGRIRVLDKQVIQLMEKEERLNKQQTRCFERIEKQEEVLDTPSATLYASAQGLLLFGTKSNIQHAAAADNEQDSGLEFHV
jgi:hypoxanthine phosphoribosyltransferase